MTTKIITYMGRTKALEKITQEETTENITRKNIIVMANPWIEILTMKTGSTREHMIIATGTMTEDMTAAMMGEGM